MSITKCNLNANYSKLPNGLILDKSISTQALKVIIYLWSLPDGWIVNNTDVCNKLGISDRTIYKYWRELINSGWVTRYQTKTKGKFGNFEYHLNEFPVKDVIEDIQENRHTEKLHTVETAYGETGGLTNTHCSNKTHSNNNTHINKEKIQKKENPRCLVDDKGMVREITYTNQYTYIPTFSNSKSLPKLVKSIDKDWNVVIKEVIDYFNNKTNSRFKKNQKTLDNLNIVLKHYTLDEIKLVIDYVSTDEWYIENNQIRLSVIMRPSKFGDKLERAIICKNNPVKKPAKFNDMGDFSNASSEVYSGADFLRKVRGEK